MHLQADNLTTLIKAANISIEPYWPSLFAKLFESRSVADLITNVGAGEGLCSFARTSCPRSFTLKHDYRVLLTSVALLPSVALLRVEHNIGACNSGL